jgi:hypothetical protein
MLVYEHISPSPCKNLRQRFEQHENSQLAEAHIISTYYGMGYGCASGINVYRGAAAAAPAV